LRGRADRRAHVVALGLGMPACSDRCPALQVFS
jgi:hypothetical protein